MKSGLKICSFSRQISLWRDLHTEIALYFSSVRCKRTIHPDFATEEGSAKIHLNKLYKKILIWYVIIEMKESGRKIYQFEA